MSYSLENQTNLIPKQLYGISSSGDVDISITSAGIVLGGDLTTTPIYATVNQSGLSTTNPNGLQVLSSLNMNGENIVRCPSVSNSQGDITISSVSDNVNLSAGGGANCSITAGTTNISANDILTITGTTAVLIKGTNDLIGLNAQNGVYINQSGSGEGEGDGNITASNFFGNATTADTATYATSSGSSLNTQSIQVNQNTANATNYITFADGYTTSLRSLRSNSGLTYNPSTNTITATTFSGNLSGTANSATASQTSTLTAGNNFSGSNWYPCVVSGSTAGNYSLNSYSNLSYIPNTNTFSCNISGNSSTATNSTNAINCSTTSTTTSGTYYPVFVSNNVSGNYPNLVGVMTYNPSSNTVTANTFNGALSGTATNSTNASVTSDNTSGTYYIPFTKTSGTGNKPLFQDDTTGPLTYNPSTGNMSAISYTITGTPSTASVASTFGQVGLVYLSTSQFSVVGSASTQNFSVASIFNSTYQNYRVVINSASQVSYSAYPTYSLAGYLGTGVPTTGSLYGNELTSAASSSIVAVYTAGATLSSAPLQFAVSSLTNKQVVLEVEGVGFANTATNVVGLKCKSFYGNPGVSGYSDRNIVSSSLSGATITGLTIQQSSLGVGNNMTLQFIVYGYNLI
jgi:hypothetical protein